jgi:hypothetical protein
LPQLSSKTIQMKKLSLVLLAFIAIAGISFISSCKSSQSSAGKVLKFGLQQGKGYDYEVIWDMDQKLMGQQSTIKVSAGYTMLVTNDDGKVKTLSGQYRNFRMDMKMMGIEMDIDTDKPTPAQDTSSAPDMTNMLNRVFRAMVGRQFSMKVDEEGKVLEVKGFEEMVSGMLDSLGLNAEQKQIAQASLKDQFNEQNVKDQFAQIFNIFPNKEVKVGDTWEKSFSTGGKLKADYNTKFTVKEIEGDFVTLATKTTIKSNDATTEVKGEQEGDMIVDSRTGLVTSGDATQDIEVTTGKDSETKTPGMVIAIKGKLKISGKAI